MHEVTFLHPSPTEYPSNS